MTAMGYTEQNLAPISEWNATGNLAPATCNVQLATRLWSQCWLMWPRDWADFPIFPSCCSGNELHEACYQLIAPHCCDGRDIQRYISGEKWKFQCNCHRELPHGRRWKANLNANISLPPVWGSIADFESNSDSECSGSFYGLWQTSRGYNIFHRL